MSAGGVKLGDAIVVISANMKPLDIALKRMEAKFKKVDRGLKSMGATALKVGAVIATPLALALKTGIAFEDQMARVRSVLLTIPQDTFQSLIDQAKLLGRTTSFTASQIAQGMEVLSRAGLKAAQTMEALPNVLNLARGGAIEIFEAAGIATKTMNQFSKEAKDLAYIGDILGVVANNTQTNIRDLGEALRYSGSTADAVGQSFEETVMTLGLLADNALVGSIGGTSLNQALLKLLNPTKKATALFEKWNWSMTDGVGKMKPFTQIIKELQTKMQGLTPHQKGGLFKDIFEARGVRAALAVVKALDRDGVEPLRDSMSKATGTMALMAKVMDDTLGGSIRMMLSAFADVQIAVTEALNTTVRAFIDGIKDILNVVTPFIEKNKTLVLIIAAVASGLLALGSVLVSLGVFFGAVGFAIVGIAAAVSILGTAMSGMLVPILAVTSALGLVATRFFDIEVVAQNTFTSIANILQTALTQFREYILGIRVGGAQIRTWLVNAWLGVLQGWYAIAAPIQTGFDLIVAGGRTLGELLIQALIGSLDIISSAYYSFFIGLGNQINELASQLDSFLDNFGGIGDALKLGRIDLTTEEKGKAKSSKFYGDASKASKARLSDAWSNFDANRVRRDTEAEKSIKALRKDMVQNFILDPEPSSGITKSTKEQPVMHKLSELINELDKTSENIPSPGISDETGNVLKSGAEVFSGGNIGERLGILSTTPDQMVEEQKKSNDFLSSIFDTLEDNTSSATYAP